MTNANIEWSVFEDTEECIEALRNAKSKILVSWDFDEVVKLALNVIHSTTIHLEFLEKEKEENS